MKQELKLSHIIQGIFVIIAIIAILLLWPVKAFTEQVTSAVPDESYMTSEAITPEANIMQEFIPEHSHVDRIQIMAVPLAEEPGKFMFHFYDKDLTLLWEADRKFEGTEASYFTFPIEMQLHAGEPYYYTLDYVDTPFAVCYDEAQMQGQNGNGRFYYALQEIPGTEAITQYHYITDFSWQKVMALDAILLAAMFVLCLLAYVFFRLTGLDRMVSTNKAIHAVLGTAVSALMLYVIWQVGIKQIFNTNWIDITVYLIGIMLLTTTLLYGIMRINIADSSVNVRKWKEKAPNCLQILFIALAILSCADFVNAGSNYAQGLALREVCSYLGLAIIVLFTKKELYNLWNMIYAVAAGITGFLYCRPFAGQGEPFETAIRTAVMAAIWGIILLAAIYNLIRKKIVRAALPYAGLVGVFFALLIGFRHSNVWEIAVVVPFSLLYLRRIEPRKMNQMLHNITNGIILSFIVLTVQALMYRPFHYYMMIRYSGMFTTVTVTAVYLVLIFAVAVCRLLIAYNKSHTLRGVWKELVLLGVVCGYQFLTLSRTGILTCVAVYLVAIVVYMALHYKRHTEMWKYLGYTIITIIWFIPIVFTVTRMIPPLVNDPLIYNGEEFLDSIKKGEPINSYRQITVERFLGLSTQRILGQADLNHVTKSGLTVEEAIEAAKKQESSAPDAEKEALEESGVTIKDDSISYIDEYGSEYTIETPGYSNGRLDIFTQYLQNLNLTGHPTVGLPQEDGTTIVHAHNSFIQMAYDCGIITGIVFLLFYVILGFRSIKYYICRHQEDDYAMLPVIIFAAFGISSMVEYVFRPTIPLGFVFLLMITPLLTKFENHPKHRKSESSIEME